jgi:adenosylcobinamide-phosphate guanylyltransferase
MSGVEKPLLEISGKTMLQHIIQALKHCSSVDRIVVASTSRTPATTAAAEKLGAGTIITPGDGFEEDMRFAVRRLSLAEVLVISADLVFITPSLIEEAIRKYRESGKPALAVMAPPELYEKFGSNPAYMFEVNGRMLLPVGINIINGKRIDEGTLEQTELVIGSEDAPINVNTPNELDFARKTQPKPEDKSKHGYE